MRTYLKLTSLLLASIISIKSQSQFEKKIEYSDSRPISIFLIPRSEVIKKYFTEIENESRKSPLFAPKDEFETDAQYQNRIKEAQLYKESLVDKYRISYIEYLKNEEK